MVSKEEKVKSYFENTSNYLDDNVLGIQARIHIIKNFLRSNHFNNLLDVPCGNGEISVALAELAGKITMVDIATNMVRLAKENTPENIMRKCTYYTGNIYDVDLKHATYDCILAIGILGHVDSPDIFIEYLDKLIQPGGILVLQNTDDSHFKVKIQKLLRGQKKLVQKDSYELNTISHKWLVNKLESLGYTLQISYKFETRMPWVIKKNVVIEKQLENIWKLFGDPLHNTMSILGSRCIYKFKKC